MRSVPLLGAMAACVLNASPIYRVIDLGALGGASAATGLNSSGAAVGWSLDGRQSMRAVGSNEAGGPRSLSSAPQSRATGINDAGQIAGIRYDAYGNAMAVMWRADGVEVALGGANSYAMAINASGVVAGAASGRAVRFLADGSAVGVGVNAPWSSANAIDDSGAVAGTAQLASGSFRAFTAPAGGGAAMLGTLGGASSYGHGINGAGWVVGGSTTATGYLHAFLYSGGGARLRDLGTLAGGANSSAYDVNGLGQVVGASQLAGGAASAFLWENGRLMDLNELIAADTGWRLLEASGINNHGQIVGFGVFAGVQRAFRLDPVETPASQSVSIASAVDGAGPIPEPGSWVLAAIGLAGIALSKARRSYFI